jgi:polyphosphate kinase 2
MARGPPTYVPVVGSGQADGVTPASYRSWSASCRRGSPATGRVPRADTHHVINGNFREYLEQLLRDGYSVRPDEHLSDPDLIDPGGDPVETWREEYPYDERLDRDTYETEKYQLQVELLKFQNWAQDTGTKHVVLFEGRDAAGKGGTIKRFMEHLNPRAARVVALTKPTETEIGQWYFHRYVAQLPTAGEIVLFDRSWYNRAGVERVMGFVTDSDYRMFLRQAPLFEAMLIESGFTLTKLWFSVTRSEQRTRFAIRQIDPVRRWKLSPMDIQSLDRWDDYTAAKEAMIEQTDTDYAPWTSIRSNDKKRARINAMRFFLNQFNYADKDASVVYPADPRIVQRGRDSIKD